MAQAVLTIPRATERLRTGRGGLVPVASGRGGDTASPVLHARYPRRDLAKGQAIVEDAGTLASGDAVRCMAVGAPP